MIVEVEPLIPHLRANTLDPSINKMIYYRIERGGGHTIVTRRLRLFKTEINPATGLKDERTLTEHLLVMRCRS
jgi:hypothetical protein